MQRGNKIKATWVDGLVLCGTYVGTDRGYIVLKSESGERIICHSTQVKFEILNDELSDDDLEKVCGGMSPRSFERWKCGIVNGD